MLNPPSDFDESIKLAQSPAEVVLLIDRLCSREIAEFAVRNISPERRSLQRMAKELKAGGAVDLSKMVAECAKHAPLSPQKTFRERWKPHKRRPFEAVMAERQSSGK